MDLKINKYVRLNFDSVAAMTECYRSLSIDYPKFFKMDALSKLGFLAAEMLLKDDAERFMPREDIALVAFNRSASLDTDINFQATIADADNFFPSPSVFVYTLPNIVLGEIALRNKFLGETSFYVSENFDARLMVETVENTFQDRSTKEVIASWIECGDGKYEVFMARIDNSEKK